ncbi:MAG: hypothetical protein ACKV2U_28890 [Bryobacteraceae bacterium]
MKHVWLLAFDFYEKTWRDDSTAFPALPVQTMAHTFGFSFEQPVPAGMARRLGSSAGKAHSEPVSDLAGDRARRRRVMLASD